MAKSQGKRARIWWRLGAALALVLAGTAGTVGVLAFAQSPGAGKTAGAGSALASNPNLDPGTPLSGPAPDFTLTDQFGQPVSLHAFRGRVVLLAFVDSECTTVCPLTTQAMIAAKGMLGASGDQIALLGVDANPDATAVSNVLAYSRAHGMLHQWHFLTGSPAQLRRVWKAYGIAVQVEQGAIDHTPALYAITPDGSLSRVYMTQMGYASIPQQAQVLAQEASRLLSGRPHVAASLSYDPVPLIRPDARATLPQTDGGTVQLGPGSPRLLIFFASWLGETSSLVTEMEALNQYQAGAAGLGLPTVVAVDEGSVEPSSSALHDFLASLPGPLSYPVAVDGSGRLADGYGVVDQPWYVLTSSSGRILWHHDGWLSVAALTNNVRAALAGD